MVQTSFLGDVVLTTPLIARLAEHGPVDVVTTSVGAAVLRGNPDVRRLWVFDKRGRHAGWSGLRALAREVRTTDRNATAYLAQGSARSALLVWLAGYRRRVGFDTSSGRFLYTRRVRYQRQQHHAERLWRLGSTGDGPEPAPEQIRPRLFPSDDDRRAVDSLLAGAGYGGERLLALAPGSAWGTKRWPEYAQLARRLTTLGRLVVVGGGEDGAAARLIGEATAGAAIDATGRLSLLGSAALIATCRVLVGNDSAPQHLASAMGTPTVTVFGPTVPEFGFGPLAPGSVSVGVRGLSCRPCHPHGPEVCPLGHWKCMRELDVATVWGVVNDVMRQRGG